MAQPDQEERQAHLDLLAHLDQLVHQDLEGIQVPLVRVVPLARQDQEAKLDHLVKMDLLGQEEKVDHLDPLDHQGRLVLVEALALEVHLVPEEKMELLVFLAHLVNVVKPGLQVQLDQQDQPDHLVPVENQDQMENREAVFLVLVEKTDHQVLQVLLVQWVKQAHLDLQGQLGLLDHEVNLDQLVNLEIEDKMDHLEVQVRC